MSFLSQAWGRPRSGQKCTKCTLMNFFQALKFKIGCIFSMICVYYQSFNHNTIFKEFYFNYLFY